MEPVLVALLALVIVFLIVFFVGLQAVSPSPPTAHKGKTVQLQKDLRQELEEIELNINKLEIETANLRKFSAEQFSEIEDFNLIQTLASNLRGISAITATLNESLNAMAAELDPDLNRLRMRLTKRVDVYSVDTLKFLEELDDFFYNFDESKFQPNSKKALTKPFYFATHCGSCGSELSSRYICFNCSPLSD
jgi:hypothetical protein